jgi:tetratricopeptide (TPR) repeat protein
VKSFWLLAAVAAFGAATVFISLTRGGMVSLLIAAVFTTLLVASRRSLKKQGWIMVVMVLIAFICVLYMGFDRVYDRLASLRDFDKAQAFRLQILKDIAIAWKQFPIFGTGLGTHAVVYPMFDRSTITALAAHAENEYAQAIEETGIIGLGLLIIFGIIVWSNYVKCIRDTELTLCSLAYGLGFGLLAILIHSFSDFGQHLPANAVLSAIFCALLLVLAHHKDKRLIPSTGSARENNETYRARFVIRGLILVSASVIWIWCLTGANSARVAESLWKNVHGIEKCLADRSWQGSSDEFKDLISGATQASACESENVKYLYWLNVYRWHSISQTTDTETGKTIISEQAMPVVYDIVDQFNKARILCPTYGPTYSVLGQIEKFILNDDTGAERIRKGFHLAPCDPMACFVAGYLDASEGKSEDCVEKFKRAVQLDYRLLKNTVNICVNQLSHPHLAMLIAGDNFGWLIYVAEVFEDMQYDDLAEQTWEKARKLLEVKCSQPDATAAMLASLGNIYRKQHNNGAAITYYRRALALDYGQVHWRLTLAELLAEKRQIPEAVYEARICLRLRPQFEAAENLLAELSVNSAAFDEEVKSPDEL